MSESYTMDDYIKENIIDKYNLRKTVNGYTTFNSNAIVTDIIDSVNEKLKAIKELKIEIKKKEIEKDFIDETL